jgi:predicted nucleic acid-binding Zn ribbon protein
MKKPLSKKELHSIRMKERYHQLAMKPTKVCPVCKKKMPEYKEKYCSGKCERKLIAKKIKHAKTKV